MRDEEKKKIIDALIHNIVFEKLTHSCIKCHSKFVKEEGCNLMTCPSCGAMSCYICNILLSLDKHGNKYWHFSGHENSGIGANCPLWNNFANDGKESQGNTEFNIKQIFKEFTIIMEQNDEFTLRKLVIGRIALNFKREKSRAIYELYSCALAVKFDLVDMDNLSHDMKHKVLLLNF